MKLHLLADCAQFVLTLDDGGISHRNAYTEDELSLIPGVQDELLAAARAHIAALPPKEPEPEPEPGEPEPTLDALAAALAEVDRLRGRLGL